MQILEPSLFSGLVCLLGGLSFVSCRWAGCGICPLRAAKGRWLVGTLMLLLGLAGNVTAYWTHHSLLPFGLLLGLLFIGSLWESSPA